MISHTFLDAKIEFCNQDSVRFDDHGKRFQMNIYHSDRRRWSRDRADTSFDDVKFSFVRLEYMYKVYMYVSSEIAVTENIIGSDPRRIHML